MVLEKKQLFYAVSNNYNFILKNQRKRIKGTDLYPFLIAFTKRFLLKGLKNETQTPTRAFSYRNKSQL